MPEWLRGRGISGEYGFINTKTGEFRTTLPNSVQEKKQEISKQRKAVLKTHSARQAKFQDGDGKRRNHSDETIKKTINIPILTMNSDGTFSNNYINSLAPAESSLSTEDPITEFYIGNKVLTPAFTAMTRGVEYGLGRYGSGQLQNWARGRVISRNINESINEGINNTVLSTLPQKELVNRIKFGDVDAYTFVPGYGYKKVIKEPLTSLKFFERPTSKLTQAERAGVSKADRFVRPFKVNNYPGYQLGLLMRGSPLERQLSKSGLINVNNILNLSKKESKADQYIIQKVLNEQFTGQKNIPYNKFKQAVQKELVNYEQVPDTRFQDYGLNRLYMGYTDGDLQLNTFTLQSSRIPVGNGKHYNTSTLGHIRTFTDKRNPKTLNVLESQSDWGQSKYVSSPRPYTGMSSYLNNPEEYRKFIDRHKRLLQEMKDNLQDYSTGAIERQEQNIAHHESILQEMLLGKQNNLQTQYLHDNYISRQLQELLKYGAKNKYNNVRFPTPNTAATIEGYEPNLSKQYIDLQNRLANLETKYSLNQLPNEIDIRTGQSVFYTPERRMFEINKIKSEIKKLEESGKMYEYSPEHQTILNKYAGFPKLWQKKYKTPVRTVTDLENNTWYEVDIPEGYLNKEWKFKQGGKL